MGSSGSRFCCEFLSFSFSAMPNIPGFILRWNLRQRYIVEGSGGLPSAPRKSMPYTSTTAVLNTGYKHLDSRGRINHSNSYAYSICDPTDSIAGVLLSPRVYIIYVNEHSFINILHTHQPSTTKHNIIRYNTTTRSPPIDGTSETPTTQHENRCRNSACRWWWSCMKPWPNYSTLCWPHSRRRRQRFSITFTW